MNFQKTVIAVATSILLLMLLFISYSLAEHLKVVQYPPSTAACPDFWISANKQCSNPQKIGKCAGPMDFNVNEYRGYNGRCKKLKWANSCGLSWNGVTNNPELNRC